MPPANPRPDPGVALVTGAGQRIGAHIARTLHAAGLRLVIHHHRSAEPAAALAAELNAARAGSAATCGADLLEAGAAQQLIGAATQAWGRLDVLVNNASTFFPTPVGEIDEQHWHDLLGTNLRAPLFLSQAAAPELAAREGAIVNIADIHALRPRPGYLVYCAAKAGLIALTRGLARELAPRVRVNAVAPGAILWPADDALGGPQQQREVLAQTPLGRLGEPRDVAEAVRYLALEARFVTGQVLSVDGGRLL